MKVMPVEMSKGSFFIRQSGKLVPFLSKETAPELSPGWTPIRILTGLPKLTVLQLKHDNGDLALWFLSPDFRFLGNHPSLLDEDIRVAAHELLPDFPTIPWDQIDKSDNPSTLRGKHHRNWRKNTR